MFRTSPRLSGRLIRRTGLAALLVLVAAAFGHAQLTSTWVSLDDRTGPPDHPFGLNVTPDGRVYHVAIAGSFSSPNRLVAAYDRQLGRVVGRYPVGRFPEEIAYEYTPGISPVTRAMFVTNSSDGTVSVLGANGNPIGTIALGAGDFPFGIAMSPDQRRLAVTTKNSVVYAIDVATRRVTSTIAVPGFHGRAVFLPDGRVAFGMSTFSQTVEAKIVDFARPSSVVTIPLYGPSSAFPSSEDVALVRDGRELWFPVLNGDRSVRRIDPATGTQVGTISLAGVFAGTGVHGIAASGEGHAIVTSLTDDAIALLETDPPRIVSTLAFALGNQPNDAVFTPDAREACVTMQVNAPGIHVLRGLPTPALRLLADSTSPRLGSSVRLTLRGAPAFSVSVIALSLVGDGPVTVLGEAIRLTPPIAPVWTGTHDATGRLQAAPVKIPAYRALDGLRVYLHALTQEPDRSLRVSNPLVLTLTQ